MDDLQQRIIEIALQIPGYLGYEAKERRRDMDKHTRLLLAGKYDAESTRLKRIARNAPLEYANAIENLNQKLGRLIARFHTAPRGYAGWFDAAQIVEEDLDALTKFDAALASGVPQLKAAIDQIASAIKTKQNVVDATDVCAELLDTLNAQFDQREQLIATGKKPTLDLFANLASPLTALKPKKQPAADFTALADLKLKDAVTYDDADYLVSGKITYNTPDGKLWAYLLQDTGKERWLRLGPDEEIAICEQIELSVPEPLPDSIRLDSKSYVQTEKGTANVTVEGAGGTRRGVVNYARYRAGTARLWLEDFGDEERVMVGQTVDQSDLKIYKR